MQTRSWSILCGNYGPIALLLAILLLRQPFEFYFLQLDSLITICLKLDQAVAVQLHKPLNQEKYHNA